MQSAAPSPPVVSAANVDQEEQDEADKPNKQDGMEIHRQENQLLDLFEQIDTNEDGSLSTEEIARAFGDMQLAEQCVADCDMDQDGELMQW